MHGFIHQGSSRQDERGCKGIQASREQDNDKQNAECNGFDGYRRADDSCGGRNLSYRNGYFEGIYRRLIVDCSDRCTYRSLDVQDEL